MELKALTQKNTLLKNAQANAERNFFKRVFFSPPKEKLFLKNFPPTKKIKTHRHTARQTQQTMTRKLNIDKAYSDTVDRRPAGNSGFKKLAVQWLNEVQFSNQTFVVADSLVLRNRQLLKPTKR
jgi:hypothetical protein